MKARALGLGLTLALLGGCAAPAVVFVSPRYPQAQVKRVVLAGFQDFPGAGGSGQVASAIFEKYLLLAGYSLADRGQAEAAMSQEGLSLNGNLDPSALRLLSDKLGVDAIVFGQITDFTDTSDHTVMEDMPLEVSNPIMGHTTTVVRTGDGQKVRTDNDVVTGYTTSYTDVPVQTTETEDAHVGLSVRLVGALSGEMLWSGSASASDSRLHGALEDASASVMQAVAKRLPAPGAEQK